MPKYFVAIDGGGTKTDVVYFDDTGQVHNRVIGESTNPNALSVEQITKRFNTIFSELFKGKNLPPAIDRCFAGMSGADHPILNDRLKTIIGETLPAPCPAVQVENDAVNALWSGTEGQPGFVVIAGTGSIAYGRFEKGESFRIGGWGHLVSDEGSGYYIGKEAVRAALRAHDNIEEWSPLFDQLKMHFNIERMPDVIPIVYNAPKIEMAALVPVVEKAASQGDAKAIEILENAVGYLGELIKAGLAKFDGAKVPVVLAGGLWRANTIRKRITQNFNQNFIFPEVPPVFGSMIGALESKPNESVLKPLRDSFKK